MKLLSWNVRGINARERRGMVRSIIKKHDLDFLCLQETKLETMSTNFFSIVLRGQELKWALSLSEGHSWGLSFAWKNSSFQVDHVKIEKNWTLLQGSFTHRSDKCTIINIYGPCCRQQREEV